MNIGPRYQRGFWGALAAAGIGAIGDIMGQSSANAANAKIAQKQMDFQERMSGSSYQRAVKDMMAAGLNPMLAYSQGGASTPSGSSAHMESVTGGRLGDRALSVMSTAAQVANVKADTGLKFSQEKEADARRRDADAAAVIKENSPEYNPSNQPSRQAGFDAQISKVKSEAVSAMKDVELKGNQVQLSSMEIAALKPLVIEYQRVMNQLARANVPEAEASARFWKDMKQSDIAKWLQIVRSVMPSVGPIGPRGR